MPGAFVNALSMQCSILMFLKQFPQSFVESLLIGITRLFLTDAALVPPGLPPLRVSLSNCLCLCLTLIHGAAYSTSESITALFPLAECIAATLHHHCTPSLLSGHTLSLSLSLLLLLLLPPHLLLLLPHLLLLLLLPAQSVSLPPPP